MFSKYRQLVACFHYFFFRQDKIYPRSIVTVYLYHEISQLFKKETRDFAVLQNERVEGSKFVISMRSVGWPGCPEEEDVVRGKVRYFTQLILTRVLLSNYPSICKHTFAVRFIYFSSLQFLSSGWIIEPCNKEGKNRLQEENPR